MANNIYLYGIIPNNEEKNAHFPSFKGIDDYHEAYLYSFGRITAVLCELDEQEYSKENIQQKTNQMEWVQEKAYHHHEMLMKIRDHSPVIPMKFCTIYSGQESLEQMLQNQENELTQELARLENKEEWNLKIYSDSQKLKEQVEKHNETIEAKKEEIAQMSPGRQYLEKRKLEQVIDQEVEKEQQSFCSALHNELDRLSEDSTVKKNWSKDVTGKKEDMCWNSAYLVSLDQVERALEKISELKATAEHKGWQIEATGPWPPYHFVNLSRKG